jgi:hypothetical protein
VKNIGESACAACVVGTKHPEHFKKINEEKVFNLEEAGLFWQKSPMCTFMSKIVKTYPGFKVYKDHITNFLNCDASGGLYGKTCTYLLFHKSSDHNREEQEPLFLN